jgi:hypothetical protein
MKKPSVLKVRKILYVIVKRVVHSLLKRPAKRRRDVRCASVSDQNICIATK